MTQRFFALALLARRPLVIHRPLLSEDIHYFLGALEAAGFRVEHGENRLTLTPQTVTPQTVTPQTGTPQTGTPQTGTPQTRQADSGELEIFCGAGGTMLRFLTAVLTAVPGRWRLDGVPRLRERPVLPLVEALRRAGAEIVCEGPDGFAPLHLVGASLRGGATRLDAGSSSQFLSALLMAGLVTPEPLCIEVEALTSEPYVDLTLSAIRQMGGEVERRGNTFKVHPALGESPGEVRVEADFSAAAYPAAAAALTGGEVTLNGLRADSFQGDRAFLDVLAEMGASLEWREDAEGESSVVVRGGDLRAVDADLEATPDQVPTLAALAPFARGTTRIRNVPHLRLKESDRLAAMTAELRRVGAEVEELADGLVIQGSFIDRVPSSPVTCQSHGDHRIAMAMAVVGLRRPNLSIAEPAVVAKSYPWFWRDLEQLIV